MMKRILAGLMILMMAVTCVSCKKKEESNASFGGTTYEDQPDEEINTEPDVTDEEQGEEEEETPSTDAPTEEEPKTEDQTKDPAEEPSEGEKQDEEQTPAEDEKQDEEQTPEEDKTPEEEQKPEEDAEPTYPGDAVTFTTESVKIAYHGLYNDVEDLMTETVGGETLLLLNSSEDLENFNAQISAWMDTSSGGEEETEDDYEEAVLFDLEGEMGRAYNSTYFNDNSLLLLCVSGTVGAVKAVTVEGTQLNIYIESAAGTGTGVLGDLSTSIVALEVASTAIVDCTAYKINTI